jgi:hypothetical protein
MSDDLLGLTNLGQMYYNKGLYYEKLYDYENMENAFKEAAKFNHTQAMNRLGLYYDDNADHDNMLKYYNLAIEFEETSAMYNLARYYHDKSEYDNMIKYYLLAIECKDTDSCYELASYYQTIQDIDNLKKYYLLATEIEIEKNVNNKYNLNNGIDEFNPFTLQSVLESIENPNPNILNKIDKLKNCKQLQIYNNKIRLFTKLNYMDDCSICFENKLHIDIFCGHCVCIDCYPKLFDKSCPFCRISKNSTPLA